VVALTETWTDYDGNSPYADYTVDGSTLTQTAIYQPGIGRSFDPTDPAATEYYHTDLIGTTRLMTDTPGLGTSPNVVSESSFTAFGEQIGGTAQRYGYAGEWGYQTDPATDGFSFLHVGARYYDPATGRFLQRDPIGIRGGLNVYAYVEARPTNGVDSEGLHHEGYLHHLDADEYNKLTPDAKKRYWYSHRAHVYFPREKPRPPKRVDTEDDIRKELRKHQMVAAACAILIGLTGIGGAFSGSTAIGVAAGGADVVAGGAALY